MSRKRIFTVLGVFILIGLIVLAIVTFINSRSGSVRVTDLVMNGVSDIDTLSSQKFNFFNGSAVATVDLTKTGRLSSTVATSDTPFAKTYKDDYRESTNTLLAQILYTSDDIYSVDGFHLSTGAQQIWITQTGTQAPKLFDPFGGSKTILDAKLSNDGVVFLTNDGGAKNNLYIYTTSLQEVATNIDDNQILGVFKTEVVTRNQAGKTNVHTLAPGGKNWSIDTSNEKVMADKTTGSVVVQDNKNTVFIYKDNKRRSVGVKEKNMYVSRGYVIALDSSSLPKKISVIDIANGKKHSYKSSFLNEATNEEISGAVMINPSVPTFGLVTSSGSLLVASSDTKITSDLKTYNYPSFSNTSLVNFDVGSAQATIYSTNVQESLSLLSKDCSCDINQIHKFWQANAYANPYQPTLDQPQEEDY